MLEATEIVNKFLKDFDFEYDNRSNKIYNIVSNDKNTYIEIVKLYLEGMSSKKISNIVNKDSKYIITLLNRFGVNIKSKRMTKEDLKNIIEDYKKGESICKLSKKYNYSLETVKRRLNENGIDTSKKPKINIESLDDIVELYKKHNVKKISEIYNCSTSTVKRFLKDNNIKTRSLSESMAIKIKNEGVNFKGKNINYYSLKNNTTLLANSTYEEIRFKQLDNNEDVVSFTRDVPIIKYHNETKTYTPDILVLYKNGSKSVEEIKPIWYLKYMYKILTDNKSMNCEEIAKKYNISKKSVEKFLLANEKLEAAKKYFKNINIEFKIITEKELNI